MNVMTPHPGWLYISIDYATYSVEIRDGRCVSAAPIARWMVGKTEDEIRRWVERKGGRVEGMAA